MDKLLLLVAVVSCIWMGKAPIEEDRVLEERFRREAPEKWKEYQERSSYLQGTKQGQFHLMIDGKTKQEHTWSETIRQRPQCACIIRKYSDGKEEIFGQNTKYSFCLRRQSSSKDWKLHRLAMEPEAPISVYGMPVVQDAFESISPHFTVYSHGLMDLVKDPSFKVKDVHWVDRGEKQLVGVECSFTVKKDNDRKSISGIMFLDPDRFWCVSECEWQAKDDSGNIATIHEVNEYRTGANRLPVVDKDKSALTATEGGVKKITGVRSITHTYQLYENADVPEYEFTLSAFGLPEPQGIYWERPTPYYLYFGAAAVILLALGVGLRILHVQRKASGKTSSST